MNFTWEKVINGKDAITHFLYSNLYSSMQIYTRFTCGHHLSTGVPFGDGVSVCLLSLFCTPGDKFKINGREVATQRKKKFKVTFCTATVSCKPLTLQAKQRCFGAPARCSGRRILTLSSTPLHPSPFIPQEKPLD